MGPFLLGTHVPVPQKARAFEEEIPEEILGMKRYSERLAKKKIIRNLGNRFRLYYSNGSSHRDTCSSTHGGFDNDVATMNTVLMTILGRNTRLKRFTRESLDY